MTAYGLLTYTLLGDVGSALPVVKWLSQQRNALGGFSSTQVTAFFPAFCPFSYYTVCMFSKDDLDFKLFLTGPVPGHVCGSAGLVRVRHLVLCRRGEPHHLSGFHQP